MRRTWIRHLLPATPLLALLSTSDVLAEGTADLGVTQALRSGTVLYVDIVDSAVEQIEWTGVGSVSVSAPDGAPVAVLSSGQDTGTLSGLGGGAYRLVVHSDQDVGTPWDVRVLAQTDALGRLHSYDWRFNAGAFSEERATSSSFYAVVPGGGVDEESVIELNLEGLAGYVYNINANRVGVEGPNGGRSVPQAGNSTLAEFPIYLNPPSNASYSASSPLVNGLEFVGGTSLDWEGNSMDPCDLVVPGGSTGRFQFTSTAQGSYHLMCDLDQNGVFDPVGGADLLLVGSSEIGLNEVQWDGMHDGAEVALGTYDCQVQVNVGEFHYVGADIETSYPGMRLYEVHPDLGRSPLRMYWNDTAVQGNAQPMPSGELGLRTSGAQGLFPGAYDTGAVANVNARSWGNWNSGGKGNQAFLDTFTWLESSTSSTIEVRAVDPSADLDADGAGDFEEACAFGTDPNDPDSDDDGVSDGEQYGGIASSGGGNGLESNGRLASALARRAIRRSRMTDGPRPGFRSSTDLLRLAPTAGTLGTSTAEATPTDLPEITNASSTYALDYYDGDARVGGVLLIETTGAVYEHSKLVCDRAQGSSIDDMFISDVGGHDVLRATTQRDGIVDHTAVFSVHVGTTGADVFAYWLTADYPTPRAEQRVVRVQTWSSIPGGELTLARAVLGRAEDAYGSLRPPGHEALWEDDAVTDGEPISEPAPQTSLPAAAVASAEVLAGTLRMDLRRYDRYDEPVLLRTVSLQEDALTQRVDVRELTNDEGWVEVDVGRVLDVTAELVVGGTVQDQVWLSDGAWAAFDDALWGGASSVDFGRTECTPRSSAGELAFAGCAHAEGTIEGTAGFGGVARHFARPVSLNDTNSIALQVEATRPFELCVQTDAGGSYCVALEAGFGERQVSTLDLLDDQDTALPHDARANLVTVATHGAGPFEVEVSGLALSREELAPRRTTAEGSRGCTIQSPSHGLWSLLLFGLAALRRRRRR
ncbi:MAG: hypothetical protein ACRBN8_36115 [Nannocystales bacterium]